MPRHPRINEAGLLYHIIARGNNGQKIFLENADYEKYLKILRDVKKKYPFKLYAYTLIPNHFHLLLEIKEQPTGRIMQALLTAYSKYVNKRYRKKGHLFQGRYKAVICEKENYFIELIRYIHLNAVRAKLTRTPDEWKWSGHNEYSGSIKQDLIDIDLVKGVLGVGKKGYMKYRRLLEDGMEIERRREFYPGDTNPFLGEDEFMLKVTMQRNKDKPKTQNDILSDECTRAGVNPKHVKQKSRIAKIVKVRKEIIRNSVIKHGYSQSEIARFLNCNNAYISRVLKELVN